MPRRASIPSPPELPAEQPPQPEPRIDQPEPRMQNVATGSQLSEVQVWALEELFNSFDTSHVGYLTRACLHEGLAHLGQTDDEIDSVWRALHVDGTGVVSLDQFVQGLGPSLAKFYSLMAAPSDRASDRDVEHRSLEHVHLADSDDEHSDGASTPHSAPLSPVAPFTADLEPVSIPQLRPVRKRSSIQFNDNALPRTSSQSAIADAEKRELRHQLERATAANIEHVQHIAELQRRLDDIAAERSVAQSERVSALEWHCSQLETQLEAERTKGEDALLAHTKQSEQQLKAMADAHRAVVGKLEAQVEQLHDQLVVAQAERDAHVQRVEQAQLTAEEISERARQLSAEEVLGRYCATGRLQSGYSIRGVFGCSSLAA